MATGEKDHKGQLTEAYRAAYGPAARFGRPDQEVAGFAAGLISADAISVGDAAEALETGISLARDDRVASRQSRISSGLI